MPGFEARALLDVVSPDAITPIDEPEFEDSARATWPDANARVIVVASGASARAYPLAILLAHEVVNDVLDGDPVVVTFSFLCGSGVVYRRTIGERTHTFAVSGKLYRANVVLFDRQTTSLWSQLDGVALRGEMTGAALEPVPSQLMSFADFRARYAGGRVLARPVTDAGTPLRIYDEAPLERYEASSGPDPVLLPAVVDPRLDPMEQVVGVRMGDLARAYPYRVLEQRRVIEDTLGDRRIVVVWDQQSRAAGVFAAGGRAFRARDGQIADDRGGSWDPSGRALEGSARPSLAPIAHVDTYWFAWSAFYPRTEVWLPE